MTVDKAEGYMYTREGRVFFFEKLDNILRFDRDPRSHLRIPPPVSGPMMMTPGG